MDTNVLLYAADEGEPDKSVRALAWLDALWAQRCGRLSFQVLQEYCNKMGKLNPGALCAARRQVSRLQAWRPVPQSYAGLELAWKIQDRYQFSFWDSMIVAAAMQARCVYLLTEDLQHGQEIDGLRVVSPFVAGPETVFH